MGKKKLSDKVILELLKLIKRKPRRRSRKQATKKTISSKGVSKEPLKTGGSAAPFSTIVQYEKLPVKGEDVKSQLGDIKELFKMIRDEKPSIQALPAPQPIQALPAPQPIQALPAPQPQLLIQSPPPSYESLFSPISSQYNTLQLQGPQNVQSLQGIISQPLISEGDEDSSGTFPTVAAPNIQEIPESKKKTIESKVIEDFMDKMINTYTSDNTAKQQLRRYIFGKRGIKKEFYDFLETNYLEDDETFTKKPTVSNLNRLSKLFADPSIGVRGIFDNLLNKEEGAYLPVASSSTSGLDENLSVWEQGEKAIKEIENFLAKQKGKQKATQ